MTTYLTRLTTLAAVAFSLALAPLQVNHLHPHAVLAKVQCDSPCPTPDPGPTGDPGPTTDPIGKGDFQQITPVKNLTLSHSFVLIIDFLLLLAGALSIIFLIVGGIRYIFSSGNADSIDKAKKTVTYAIVGTLVVIFSYVIVHLLIKSAGA